MRTLLSAIWVGLVALAVAPACGSSEERRPPTPATGDASGPTEDTPQPLVARPLGMADLTGFAYSRGPARKTFKQAIAAEKRADWPAVEKHARAALAIDPGHLEAQWLLARALAALDRNAEVGPPLVAAIAGDWLRWGPRSLEEDGFAAFRAGSQGDELRALVDRYEQQMRAIARDGLWLVGRRGKAWRPTKRGDTAINHRAEIYAYDTEQQRYVRLSRTNGAAVGFVRSPAGNGAAYVSYRKLWLPTDEERAAGRVAILRDVLVGTVDADGPRMSRKEVAFSDVTAIELSYATSLPGKAGRGVSAADPALVARVWKVGKGGAPARRPALYRLDPEAGQATPIKRVGSTGDTLRVTHERVALYRPRVDGVAADWDSAAAAGAFMLSDTRKTITLPEGQSASRHTMRWSSGRLRLAFATEPVDACSEDAADRAAVLYAVDAATGKLREIARGEHDFAPVWLDDARVAYVAWTADGVPGVRMFDAEAGREAVALDAVGGVGTQWLPPRTRCGGMEIADPGAGTPREDVWEEEWEDDDGLGTAASKDAKGKG